MQDFKLFFRSLKKRKSLSFITIGGYAISMAVLLILVAFIISEKSVNKGFENAKNIYRIIRSDDNPLVPETLENDIRNQIPGIQKMCLYNIYSRLYYKDKNQQESAELIATNDDFLDIFSFNFIYQSGDPTLSVKSNIILTKAFSEKQFGDRNPIGETIKIGNESFTVAGVVTNVPQTASFYFDAMINKELAPAHSQGYNSELHLLYNAFVLLNPEVSSKEVEHQVSGMINHWKLFKDVNLSLESLSKVYFHALPNDKLKHANSSLIYLLSCIALVIFFMTVFNYTNLTISNGYERFVEIGIKKTTGAGKKEIFRQFLSEALWISLISMILAILISYIIVPLFSEILNKKIDLTSLLSQPEIIIAGLILFLITGILSGIYPALSLSNITPIQMISGRNWKMKRHQRGGIVAIQFIITTVLIISALFINKQISYIKHADLGFDKEMMIKLDLKGQLVIDKWKILKEELLKNPNIISVSATYGNPMQKPGSNGGYFEINGEQKMINIPGFDVDEDFIKTFGMEIIQGRNFQSSDFRKEACIINEHLFRELGWENITGQKIFGTPVVGVVKDFHHDDLYTLIGNLQLNPNQDMANTLNIKIMGDISPTLKYVENQYAEIEPEIQMTFEFYDDWIQSMYIKEEQQAKAVGLFTLLAIIISSLGLIGIVEHNIHKKVKEIGIRKVNGAKVSEILTLLNKDFIKWVVIAFLIATPIAYYLMNKWLENFAYKTELSWWIFALAGLLALGIALLTVSWQSWRAATRNPVEALRYE